jgi:hypothetical protein
MVMASKKNETADTGETQGSAKGSALRLGFMLLVSFFLLCLVYFLSIGPAWLAVNRDMISIEAFGTIYQPITFLSEHGFFNLIKHYLKFWYPDYPYPS